MQAAATLARRQALMQLATLLRSAKWIAHFEPNLLNQYSFELDAPEPVLKSIIGLIQQVDFRTLCPRICFNDIWYQSGFWGQSSFGGIRREIFYDDSSAVDIGTPDRLKIGFLNVQGEVVDSVEYHRDTDGSFVSC